MHNVQEAIYFLSQQTALTNESVEKIGSATELISGIASKTNLLNDSYLGTEAHNVLRMAGR